MTSMLLINTTCEPTNTPPGWIFGYLRRDVGITRNIMRYKYYKSVVLNDMSALIYNKMTHDFDEPLTELRLNWLNAHYTRILNDSPLADDDKALLRYKLYSHLQRVEARKAA